jgi:hypothetical protein
MVAEEFPVNAMPPTRVKFRVEDVLHPSCPEVLWELFRGRYLQGELMAVTDDGRGPANFLVLKVQGIHEPVLLPAEKALPFFENGQRLGSGPLANSAEKSSAGG